MKIAIIGTGVMGRGWITQCAMTGHEVHCYDANKDILEGVVAYCSKLAAKTARKFKIDDPEMADKVAARVFTYADLDGFIAAAGGCEVFLEVIFEDMDLKKRVLGEICPKLPENVYFWSNTSSLDIDELGEASGRPERSIVTHGMNPVPMMPGVEVVPGAKTTAETLEFTRQALIGMNKQAFVGPNIPGFWVNRLLMPQMIDAMRFLEQGKITVEDGDIGLKTSLGHPQGTFKLADFVTLPTMLRVALEMFQASGDPRLYPPMILMRMVKAGENGASTGMGFYDWSEPRNPKPRDLSHYIVESADDILENVK
ncbi:MAG: 3-hydroxyacyl-CoA dehydrogenase family protein [Deltaproteobacteria bacterium]|nr:3-hydroxyacyl-CoA dehydrogenase family protein [Deltaproteobacteria bacterium]